VICLDTTEDSNHYYLRGRIHTPRQARVKGKLRKKLSKEDLALIHKKVLKCINEHNGDGAEFNHETGIITITLNKDGEMRVETDRS